MERFFNDMAHDNMYTMSYTIQRSTVPHLFKLVSSLRVCEIRSAYLKYILRTNVFIGRIYNMGTMKYRTMMPRPWRGQISSSPVKMLVYFLATLDTLLEENNFV